MASGASSTSCFARESMLMMHTRLDFVLESQFLSFERAFEFNSSNRGVRFFIITQNELTQFELMLGVGKHEINSNFV